MLRTTSVRTVRVIIATGTQSATRGRPSGSSRMAKKVQRVSSTIRSPAMSKSAPASPASSSFRATQPSSASMKMAQARSGTMSRSSHHQATEPSRVQTAMMTKIRATRAAVSRLAKCTSDGLCSPRSPPEEQHEGGVAPLGGDAAALTDPVGDQPVEQTADLDAGSVADPDQQPEPGRREDLGPDPRIGRVRPPGPGRPELRQAPSPQPSLLHGRSIDRDVRQRIRGPCIPGSRVEPEELALERRQPVGDTTGQLAREQRPAQFREALTGAVLDAVRNRRDAVPDAVLDGEP